MIAISFKGKDEDPMQSIKKDLELWELEKQAQLSALAGETQIHMKALIIDSKKRPQAGEIPLLDSSIYAEDIGPGSWGVGDINFLNHNAPWWAAFNWGSSHMVGRRVPAGQFEPSHAQPDPAFFRQDRWKKGKGRFTFVVRKPIPATNFIEKTVAWLDNRINELFR